MPGLQVLRRIQYLIWQARLAAAFQPLLALLVMVARAGPAPCAAICSCPGDPPPSTFKTSFSLVPLCVLFLSFFSSPPPFSTCDIAGTCSASRAPRALASGGLPPWLLAATNALLCAFLANDFVLLLFWAEGSAQKMRFWFMDSGPGVGPPLPHVQNKVAREYTETLQDHTETLQDQVRPTVAMKSWFF